jgi:archaellum component FlaC
MKALLLSIILCGCGSNEIGTTNTAANQRSDALSELQKRIDTLNLFAETFTEGIGMQFSDCESVTNALERKVCQISMTATATQQVELQSQLAGMAKEIQTALFGPECTSEAEVGCPEPTSAQARVNDVESLLAASMDDIQDIQDEIGNVNSLLGALTSRVTSLETRFDNFAASGQSIESLISSIQSDIDTLQNQVAEIQGVLASDQFLTPISICGDNPVSGPIFETALLSGDKSKVYGYVKTGTTSGLGRFFVAGYPDKGFTTSLNTKSCRFKVYNNVSATKVQLCWTSNRSATDAQIDAARTAGTATCTSY